MNTATKNGIKLQINGATGYVDYPTKVKPMLPTGFTLQSNGTVETPAERMKRKTTKKENKPKRKVEHPGLLLPAGIELEE